MRSSAFVATIGFFLAACDTSGAHRISGPPLVGLVVVNAHVTGERGLSRGKWPLNLDGKYSVDVVPDEPVTIQMEAGDHTFLFDGRRIDNSVLAGLFDLPPVDWCIIQGATRRDVHVSIDTPAKVDYLIDCPELIGSGRFNVSFSAVGKTAPSELRVSITRITGDRYQASATLAPGTVHSFDVPVGVYKFDISRDDCTGFGIPWLAPYEVHLVREGGESNVAIGLSCS